MTEQQFAVLIVDDQPDSVSSIRRILRLDGYRVDTASSMSELFNRDSWSNYFAILLDRRMRDGTADQILQRLTKLAPGTAIIVVTAYADLEGTLAALKYGAEDFLLKPVDPEYLRNRLRRLADLRRKEAELIHERAFAQLILDTTRALILVLDRDGIVLRSNRYFEEVCGYAEVDLTGKSMIDTIIPDHYLTEAHRHLAACYLETYEQGASHPIHTKAGDECEIAWWAAPLKDEHGEITQLVCAGHDMTAYNRLHGKLVQSERLAAIGEAMAGLAHESRNALQRSQACLDLLGDQLLDRPESLELLESIQRSQDELHRLYEEVRAYAAPIQLCPHRRNVDDILRKAWGDLVTVRDHRDVLFDERPECEDLRCEVDGFSLRQVFRNILENALQACEDPVGIKVVYSETIETRSPALVIAIRDNGPGLRPEHAAEVFSSFFTTKTNGTGLGMAIAQRIVQAHGGQITLNATLKEGAEFVVTLPRKQS